MSEKRYANIMLLGRTGVGKSAFINYLVGQEVSKTGVGMPVTQGFDTYEFNKVAGIPLRIFDSKGLEVMDYGEIRKNIISFAQEHCGSEDIFEWMHSIFYCINANAGRIEQEEIDLIKELNGKVSQTIHVIMTHCESSEEGQKKSATLIDYLRSQLRDKKVHIYCVNSVESKTRVSNTLQFGRQEVLNQIFELLWSDMSHKIAREYAKEFRRDFMGIIQKAFFEPCDHILERLNARVVIKIVFDEDDTLEEMSEVFDDCMEKCDEMSEKMEEVYQAKIKPLVEFCKEYGSSMGYKIELYSPFEFLPDGFMDIDVDMALGQSKLGKIIEEMDEPDDVKGFQLALQFGKMTKAVIFIKALMKDAFESMKTEIYRRIPSNEEIEKTVYDSFMMGFRK